MQTTHGGPADYFSKRVAMIEDDNGRAAMRDLFRARRKAFVASLDGPARDALESALANRVAALLVGVVGSYAAQGAEIDPRFIERRAAVLAFPRVTGDRLVFHRAEWSDLKPGYRRIPEPDATAPLADPDVILVPLVACTPAGVRLGQGGGFYDRTLADLRARRAIIAIGLAWEVQVADALPEAEWDARVDYIATPARLVDCRTQR